MAILYCSTWSPAEPLLAAFKAADPTLDLRVWPDSGPVEEIEYVLAWLHPTGELKRFPRLKAIFSLGAGVDKLLRDPDLPHGVPIIRLTDRALTAGMTEYVLLHVLRYHRRVPELEQLQRRAEWVELESPPAWVRRVGILGLGVLGSDAAQKLVALGFDVAGWSNRPKQIAGVTSFTGEDGLAQLLARSEILVCLLPLTQATSGILNARNLAGLPRGAAVINAARGGHVVEPDLLAALDSGQIGHATLDVFSEEPLPSSHPFWRHPKVTLTPHVASLTWAPTATEHIIANIRRHEAGQPMSPLVDPAKEY
ncbi:MAG: glyoxylate/hydroxypyruvate reductase [Rhodospirillaceae bacterium]|jgi:glyoxylate/hydroxypyruvate reductase A|nr:glyoxylate/hydroxypyruvate reductase [Rhodospirillaceae bacterium]